MHYPGWPVWGILLMDNTALKTMLLSDRRDCYRQCEFDTAPLLLSSGF